jgi:putative tryptophan/tyrosine transport system substrate-binding protein
MLRRDFMRLVSGFVALPAVARAQQARTQRIVIFAASQAQWLPAMFRGALAEAGYAEGRNVLIDVVSAEGQLDRLPILAEELVRLRPDAIVAVNTPPTLAAMKATFDIPIVSAAVSDPVALGVVKNLARPEANVTGVANMASDITTKRIALLIEMVPTARRIALFMHPDDQATPLQLRDVENSAASLAIEHRVFPMRTVSDLEESLKSAVVWNAQGIVRLAGQGFTLGAATGRRATDLGIPSMLLQRSDVEAGGLMSYFADQRALWSRVGIQVSRVLKGASPRDLPFELPTRFELVINLKTAQALRLDVPATLVARADDVIE